MGVHIPFSWIRATSLRSWVHCCIPSSSTTFLSKLLFFSRKVLYSKSQYKTGEVMELSSLTTSSILLILNALFFLDLLLFLIKLGYFDFNLRFLAFSGLNKQRFKPNSPNYLKLTYNFCVLTVSFYSFRRHCTRPC